MSVEPQKLRQAMRNWVSGVTVVSARHGDLRHGMTVSAFISVSLTPPLVLISLEKAARTHDLVDQSGSFGVSILSSQQQGISDRFAGRFSEDSDRFEGLGTHKLVTGAPLLKEFLACFDCKVVSRVTLGTHTVFIGEVLAVEIDEGLQPLVYYNQDYQRLGG